MANETPEDLRSQCWDHLMTYIYVATYSAEQPDALYHYTDATALLSMVKDGRIWLSHYQYMNDPMEGVFSKQHEARVRRDFPRSPTTERWKLRTREFGSKAAEKRGNKSGFTKRVTDDGRLRVRVGPQKDRHPHTDLRELLRRIESSTLDDDMARVGVTEALGLQSASLFAETAFPSYRHAYDLYVFSLTTKRDDLNQWRAYGSNCGGYSIGIKPDALTSELERDGFSFRLAKIKYGPEQGDEILDGVLNIAETYAKAVPRDDLYKMVMKALDFFGPFWKSNTFKKKRNGGSASIESSPLRERP